MTATAYRHAILARVASRLPIQALVRFAQVSAATNHAATEAWQTWEAGSLAMGTRRMFSDKCWMDAYARKARQKAFRFVDASKNWCTLQDVPEALATSLRAHLSENLKTAVLQFHVQKDLSVVNALCSRGRHAWATISSTGDAWQFTDALPILSGTECRTLSLFLRQMQDVLRKGGESCARSDAATRKLSVAVSVNKSVTKRPAVAALPLGLSTVSVVLPGKPNANANALQMIKKISKISTLQKKINTARLFTKKKREIQKGAAAVFLSFGTPQLT